MPRVLFDVNVPRPASLFLTDHSVEFADQRGWRELANGDLIAAAERDGFDVMVTCDQNIRYQQNIRDRKIALVVLSTNHWSTLRASVGRLVQQVNDIAPCGYVYVQCASARVRRRPGPASEP